MSRSEQHDARNAQFRSAFGSQEAARATSQPTAKTIEERAKALNAPWYAEDVPDSQGGRIHWVGNRNAQKVVYYFHGGGYGLAIFEGHVMFWEQSIKKLKESGLDFVVCFLEYGLTPKVKYPTQLIQAIEGLRFILGKGYKPSDIVVAGDSAGGNLAIAVASILLHQHPAVKPLTLEEPLAGLLLISPWVSFESSSASFKENELKDMHNPSAMKEWANDFATLDERNEYTVPINAHVSWWKGLPAKKTLNIFGGYEMFRDDDDAFGQTLAKAGVNVESVNCPLQVHVDAILDAQTLMEPGTMSFEIWKWLGEVF